VSENAKLPEKPRDSLSLTRDIAPTGDPSHMQDVEAQMRRALGLFGAPRRQEPERPASPAPNRQADRFGPAGHKRRFVQDGEVPVTVLHGRREHAADAPTNRLEAAETAAASEHMAREKAERALAEAQAVIHDLQTKLGHANLAQAELQEAARREREAVTAIREELGLKAEQLAAAEEAHAAAELRLAAAEEEYSAERAARMQAEQLVADAEKAREGAERLLQELGPHGMDPVDLPAQRPERPAATVARVPKVRSVARAVAPPTSDEAEPEPVQWWLMPAKKAKRR
jgi:hypothetical protein